MFHLFSFIFILTLSLSQLSHSQDAEFDDKFPSFEDGSYTPLIGENGELPSDYTNEVNVENNFINSQNSPAIEEEFQRFYEENAQAIDEVTEPIYGEPSEGLGYIPKNVEVQTNKIDSNIQVPQNAQSISVDALPRTPLSQTSTAETIELNSNDGNQEQLKLLEESVEKMELSIESIINRGLEKRHNEKGLDAKPLVDMPSLTERSSSDIESIGLFNEENGFREDIFSNVSYEDTLSFFKKIENTPLKSFVLRQQLIKLLLTQAYPPEKPVQNDDKDVKSWLAIRIHLLHELGEYKQSNLLLSKAGIQSRNVNQFRGLAKPWVESEMLSGRVEEICPFVRNSILNSDDIFWRKSLLVCQLLSGDDKGLSLSLNMVHENTRREDPLFYNLLDATRGIAENPILKPNEKISALHASIYMFAPDLLTPNMIQFLPDIVLRKIGKNVILNFSLRIQAAESLVERFDSIDDIALLGLLYDKVEFEEKIINSPGVERFSEAEIDGSLARALLWQASQVSGLPSTRALTLKSLWERAYRDNLYRLAARLKPELRSIKADSNLAWLAPQVIQQSLAFGDIEHAQKWWGILKGNKSLSRELALKKDKLALLMSFTNESVRDEVFQDWLTHTPLDDEGNRKDLEKILTLLEASEIDFSDNIWSELKSVNQFKYASEYTEMGALWLRLLGSSLEKQNIIQSLELLFTPFMDYEIEEIGNQTLSNIVTGLKFLGLQRTAQALTFEMLVDVKHMH